MRFDDRLSTVLARPAERPAERIAQWRQLLDLLAQRRRDADIAVSRIAFDRLRLLRPDVPVEVRRETAAGLAGLPIPGPLVALLAADVPVVAGAVLSQVQLREEEWLALLPRLTPTGRALLRHRRDLGGNVDAAMAGFGATDFSLEGGDPVEVETSFESAPTATPGQDRPAASGHPDCADDAMAPADVSIAEPYESENAATPASTGASADAAPEAEASSGYPPVEALALSPVGPTIDPVDIYFDDGGVTDALPDSAPDPTSMPHDGVVDDAMAESDHQIVHLADRVAPAPESYEPGAGEGQIRAIITRIARFREERDDPLPPLEESPDAPIHAFHFETSPDGVIRWVEGAPRGPLVGETIAVPAAGAYGVDAQAPGAFRLRAPFRAARLHVAGSGPAAGEWRISGVPVFAASDGHFLGYRGTGRRPRTDERAETPAESPAEAPITNLPADSLRQLVHELRTPLNAIGGFAEMIRRQMRGPVSSIYRDRAQIIAEHAGRLLAAVDDLDVSARLETQRLDLQTLPIDVGTMLKMACSGQAPAAGQRGVVLSCDVAANLPMAEGDPAAARRMIARLVGAAAGLAAEGETIRATLGEGVGDHPAVQLLITRPARLKGLGETELLDPGYGPEGEWSDAPLLGLGFSLHLVRRLAAAGGGALAIEEDAFVLRFPLAEEAARAGAGA